MATSTATTESNADVAYRKLRQMLCRGELVPGRRVSQSRMDRQPGCSSMPVVEAMLRLESEGLLLKQARELATIDHDADSAEYLMKRHFQSGYAEVQRILAAQAPKPRMVR